MDTWEMKNKKKMDQKTGVLSVRLVVRLLAHGCPKEDSFCPLQHTETREINFPTSFLLPSHLAIP